MKATINELQTHANHLLDLANTMDNRVNQLEHDVELYKNYAAIRNKKIHDLDIANRGSRRLWNAYIQTITQITLSV